MNVKNCCFVYAFFTSSLPSPSSDVKQHRRRRLWKRQLKVKSRCFKFYRVYSISFNSSKVDNWFWSWILKDCIEVQEKKKKVVVCSRPRENVKMASTEKCRKKIHVQSLKTWCFSCGSHRRWLSSLTRNVSNDYVNQKSKKAVSLEGGCITAVQFILVNNANYAFYLRNCLWKTISEVRVKQMSPKHFIKRYKQQK